MKPPCRVPKARPFEADVARAGPGGLTRLWVGWCKSVTLAAIMNIVVIVITVISILVIVFVPTTAATATTATSTTTSTTATATLLLSLP